MGMIEVKWTCSCGQKFFTDKRVSCPKCQKPNGNSVAKNKPNIAQLGRELWLAIHTYPIENAAPWNEKSARKWYDAWKSKIPKYNCSCRGNWKTYEAAHPLDFSSAQAFFESTVRAHNFVSTTHAKPQKPEISLQEAELIYGAPWRKELQ